MTRRSYNQTCGIARALDVLGERWTLLIVRDLLVGPRRYSDLLEGLPGIGTNLLAERLKLLESEGLVCRGRLAPPADSVTVYELTEAGRDLESVLHHLVRWSWKWLGPPKPGQVSDSRWTALALRASFAPEAAEGLDACYEFDLPSGTVWAVVRDGRIDTGLGPARSPDVVVRTDDGTLAALRAEVLSVEEAVASRALVLEGEREDLQRMLQVLSRR